MEKFIIVKDIADTKHRFNLKKRTLEFKIKTIPSNEDPVKWVKEAITQLTEEILREVEPTAMVGFTLCSPNFSRGDAWLSYREAYKITPETIFDLISSVYQSNSVGLDTDTFCLKMTSVSVPKGRGRCRKYNNFNQECLTRKGITTINNIDNLCLPRALVVAIARVNKDPDLKNIREDRKKIQTKLAVKLAKDAGVEVTEDGCGILELKQFQQYLSEFKIVVYNYASRGRDVYFKGDVASNKILNLLFYKKHYNVINSLTAAFGSKYYCADCHTPFEHIGHHRCRKQCPGCGKSPPCEFMKKINCKYCGRWFRSTACYGKHLLGSSKNKSMCASVKNCTVCNKTYKSDRKHICDEVFCKICNKFCSTNHLCYIQPDLKQPKTDGTLYVFFDLETRQETVMPDGAHLHEVNLCVFKQCCDVCIESHDKKLWCTRCGVILQILKTAHPVDRFVEYLLNQRKLFKRVVVLSHNGQAFDNQFILNHVLTKTTLKPKLIMRGTKILLMTLDNVRFLDSLNYFPMSLSKLPKAFGLTTLKKGYFPHLFNKKENQNYVGSIPSVEFYDPNFMKNDEREIFLKWHSDTASTNYIFDFKKEIEEYCVSDVNILMKACLIFRKRMLSTTNVCPFTEASTIASTCNKVFLRNYLNPDTIGIIPKNGYRWRNNQSIIAIKWLILEENTRNINIINAAKQREVMIQGMAVDGYCKETKQIFEFHGCWWHGHTCIVNERDVLLSENPIDSLNYRYENTLSRTNRLKSLGLEVIEKWECEFNKELKEKNPETIQWLDNHPLLKYIPLKIRDAFYGGRTGNTYEYYKVKEDEKINYVDICSLYPWVCKYGVFPLGHPKVLVGEDCKAIDLKKQQGIIKCEILPPSNLLHPVLPMKMNDKLMFVLCRTCGEEMTNSECNHSYEQRILRGTWVIEEVLAALKKGYEIREVFELYLYSSIQYDRNTGKLGLFTEMMNKFIKIKQESSGWPKSCKTVEERNRYIQEFFDREDVKLEFSEIIENPGLRSLAKLILNSFWGKFGQRENQSKTNIVNTTFDLLNLLTSPAIIINTIIPINDDTLLVNYENTEDSYAENPTTNVAIAAFVTAQARLKLYSYLDQLQDRVLYYDTDSVIFVSKPGDADILTGDFLGDMTDELAEYGTGSFIMEFVSGGPKNYSFKLYSTKEMCEKIVCKVKGIQLHSKATELVNFETIKNCVLDKSSLPIPVPFRAFKRTAIHEVTTEETVKLYKPNSLKRRFLEDHSSVPYGYKRRPI